MLKGISSLFTRICPLLVDDIQTENITLPVQIKRAYVEGSQLFLEATIQGYSMPVFRVVRFDDASFTLLAEDKNKIVDFIVPFNRN